jgi:hypothetical protein
VAANIFTVICVGFGVNSILRPRAAFEILELPLPASEADRKLVDSLMILYGAKELFMAFALTAVGWTGNRKAWGWTVMAASAAAFVDGAVVKAHIGTGEWNHWGYGSMFFVVGALLAGVLD